MRRNGRTDANQEAVVKMLRQCGISVQVLSSVGKGVPDLLCGFRGRNVLLEVKDGSKPPSARELTTDERDWSAKWAGQWAVANSPDEAVDIVIREVRS